MKRINYYLKIKSHLHRLIHYGLGVLLVISLFPIPIFGAVQSVIVPTFSSGTSDWSTKLTVTNFSDGTNSQASSTLAFTLNDDYYGYIYFDGYGPDNQHIANFATVFIAGGYGEYRYSYYQNGVINITSVTIQIVNLVKPDSNVDLTQIIQLLTAIESDTSSIDLLVDQTKTQIVNVLNQLVISNGYLETISKIRNYNVSLASLSFLYYLMYNSRLQPIDLNNYNYFNYPVFSIKTGDVIYRADLGSNNSQKLWLIIESAYWITQSNLNNYIDVSNFNIESFSYITTNKPMMIYRICLSNNYSVSQQTAPRLIASSNFEMIPFYAGVLNSNNINDIIFPFDDALAMYLNVNNNNLNYLNIIANGTTQSSSASGSLDQATLQFSDDANDLVTIEESFNNSMNQSLQNVNPTFNMGSSFLASANWVSTQFNRIVNNTPFASLITFGLTLGLGLLIIGKVRK